MRPFFICFALPNAKIMIHQPLGGAQGQASDIAIQASEILRTKKRLNEILSENTSQPLSKIEVDTDRKLSYNQIRNGIVNLSRKKDYSVLQKA